jgi:hypothetical protein
LPPATRQRSSSVRPTPQTPHQLARADQRATGQLENRKATIDSGSRYVLNIGMATRRRYPPPWKIEEGSESYVVTDATGQKLAYVYFENEPVRQGIMKRISRDDAWQLARAITRIPMLLQRD